MTNKKNHDAWRRPQNWLEDIMEEFSYATCSNRSHVNQGIQESSGASEALLPPKGTPLLLEHRRGTTCTSPHLYQRKITSDDQFRFIYEEISVQLVSPTSSKRSPQQSPQ